MKGVEKREQLRIIDRLRFVYKVVSKDEYERIKVSIKDSSTPFLPWSDNIMNNITTDKLTLDKLRQKAPETAELFEQLDSKLNIILSLLNPADDTKGLFESKPVYCDLSSQGFGFPTDGELKVGDILKADVIIPTPYFCQITFYSEIIRISKKEVEGEQIDWVGSKICMITDKMREIIVRHVFELQKEWLKMRHQEENAEG